MARYGIIARYQGCEYGIPLAGPRPLVKWSRGAYLRRTAVKGHNVINVP